MAEIRPACESDLPFWETLDPHIPPDELVRKIRDGRCYVLACDGDLAGVMRYNLFWDSIPFMTMLMVSQPFRGRGLGRAAMAFWEAEMRAGGYPAVMTSTQSDESAQVFYRKLGYRDAGCLLLDIPQLRQPLEIFLIKEL